MDGLPPELRAEIVPRLSIYSLKFLILCFREYATPIRPYIYENVFVSDSIIAQPLLPNHPKTLLEDARSYAAAFMTTVLS